LAIALSRNLGGFFQEWQNGSQCMVVSCVDKEQGFPCVDRLADFFDFRKADREIDCLVSRLPAPRRSAARPIVSASILFTFPADWASRGRMIGARCTSAIFSNDEASPSCS
jgi:hypothetical protein